MSVSDGYNRGRGRGTERGAGCFIYVKAARGRHARSGAAFPYAVSGASAPRDQYRKAFCRREVIRETAA
jgi:hypothetical protein